VVFIEERVDDIPGNPLVSGGTSKRRNDAGFRPTINRFAVKYLEISARSRDKRFAREGGGGGGGVKERNADNGLLWRGNNFLDAGRVQFESYKQGTRRRASETTIMRLGM